MAETTYDMAKKRYARGLWTKEMLAALVAKTVLDFSAAQYEEIVGEVYPG